MIVMLISSHLVSLIPVPSLGSYPAFRHSTLCLLQDSSPPFSDSLWYLHSIDGLYHTLILNLGYSCITLKTHLYCKICDMMQTIIDQPLDPRLSVFHVPSHVILTITHGGRHFYHPRLTSYLEKSDTYPNPYGILSYI